MLLATLLLALSRLRPRRARSWAAWFSGLLLPPLVWGLLIVWWLTAFDGSRASPAQRERDAALERERDGFAAELGAARQRIESTRFLGRTRTELEAAVGELGTVPAALHEHGLGRRACVEPAADSHSCYERWWLFRMDAEARCEQALWARLRYHGGQAELEHAYALR